MQEKEIRLVFDAIAERWIADICIGDYEMFLCMEGGELSLLYYNEGSKFKIIPFNHIEESAKEAELLLNDRHGNSEDAIQN